MNSGFRNFKASSSEGGEVKFWKVIEQCMLKPQCAGLKKQLADSITHLWSWESITSQPAVFPAEINRTCCGPGGDPAGCSLQKHSGFCGSHCVENKGSCGGLGLEGSVTLTSLPFSSWMVSAHLPWPGLAAHRFWVPAWVFCAWFSEAVSTYCSSVGWPR